MGSATSSRRIEINYNGDHYIYVTLKDKHYLRNYEVNDAIEDIDDEDTFRMNSHHCVVKEPLELPINCYFPEPIPSDILGDKYPRLNKCGLPKKWDVIRLIPFKNILYNWLDSEGRRCEMWRKTPEFTHDYVVAYLKK